MANSDSKSLHSPPIPKREESRVVYAGEVDASISTFLRQSKDSANALCNPAKTMPDPYGWMRDEERIREDVLEHLRAENGYTKSATDHLSGLRDTLYEEMKGRMQETDYTVPTARALETNEKEDTQYLYYTRTFEGKSYNAHCRAPKPPTTTAQPSDDVYRWDGSKETPILPNEQVYLDVNELAEGHSFCSTGRVTVSPSQTKVAYSLDTVGGETYKLYVQNINTKEIVVQDDALEIDSTVVWGKDDTTLFYMKMDQAHRPYQVYRRSNVGTPESTDELLYQEDDDMFWLGIYKSKDQNYLFIESSSKETSEIHYIHLTSQTTSSVQTVAKRRKKVLYEVEHHEGLFWISTNVGNTPNMRLMTAPAQPHCEEQWQDVTMLNNNNEDGTITLFDGGYQRSLDDISPFQNHIVASGRENGIPRVWILSLHTNHTVSTFTQLQFTEDAYDAALGPNYIYNTDHVLLSYDSLITPLQTLQIPLDHPTDISARRVLKEKHVPGYDPLLYTCERTWVTAKDGTTQIPVSIVHRKDVDITSPVPTHLYGYGSYGHCVEADFRMSRLPLLDRGMVYVIAHVRGGGEMGRQWYEEPNGGKYLCKKNTFQDFIDVARWLVEDRKITTSEMMSCEGRSAGGLLIGACINQAPEMFRVAVLGVPFVDVTCTMVDSTIPLTAVEWEEWGNPNEEKFHDYIKSYSPMENVKEGAKYPSCLLTGGLHDPRVQYWEPAKFAAALRHNQGSDSGKVCLKIDMTAGHFSASDRYKYLKELAFDYAFLLDQLGMANVDKI